jgi:isopenicillin-N N-acyltransferase-like protein
MIPIIKLNGTPYEQGLQHGEALREAIQHNIALYFERFAGEVKLTREEVQRRAAQYAAVLPVINYRYAVGMQGIAYASGCDYLDIVALNVRYEILYAQLSANAMGDGCTAVALHPSITGNQHLYLAQNWDWFPDTRGALLHTSGSKGWETLAFTEAGIFGGKIGLNRHGLGLVINGLNSTADDWTRLQKPFHVRCYEILRQHAFLDALAVVQTDDHNCSANFLIAQTPARVLDVEVAPGAYYAIACKNGCMVHTNHFIDPDTAGVQELPEERNRTNHRYGRMMALVEGKRPLSITDLQQFLRDHDGYPHAICQHQAPSNPAHEQYVTVTSIIMDLTKRQLMIADGQPCQNEFVMVNPNK